MLRINQIKLPIFEVGTDKEHEQKLVIRKAAALLKCKTDSIRKLHIVRRSIDARNKDDILFVYTVDVRLHDSVVGPSAETELQYIMRLKNSNIQQLKKEPFVLPKLNAGNDAAVLPADREKLDSSMHIAGNERPVVIGSGPCGLFAAYVLAECGLKPIILERGEDVDKRIRKTELFFESGKLDPDCNIQFGEGGAGTFSDGKLNTSIKDRGGYIEFVLRTFVKFGADPEILTDQKPHVGTDVLTGIVKNMRKYITELGGEYIFGARFDGFRTDDGHIVSVHYTDTHSGQAGELECSDVVLAAGHSARDTFYMLKESGVAMEAKPFAMGVRVQHPQELIDRALYGERELKRKQEILGPAAYKLTHRAANGRSCFSFCMCPGGYVVNSSSEEGRLCINGMSYNDRGSGTANSALIVNVVPEDFYEATGSKDVLSGVEFQRQLEEKAYKLCDGVIPYETFAEFKAAETNPSGTSSFESRFKGYAASADVRGMLPEFMGDAITESIEAFDKTIAGYNDDSTIIAGIEARTSSPVRILRDELSRESNIRGIYPAGEGAGYAGGITSAAADGIKTAVAIVEAVRQRHDI